MNGKEDKIFPALVKLAQRCIEEDRAEVIVLGSTTMHQAHAYLAERLPVPVINPGPLSYKIAESPRLLMVLVQQNHWMERLKLQILLL